MKTPRRASRYLGDNQDRPAKVGLAELFRMLDIWRELDEERQQEALRLMREAVERHGVADS